MGRYSTGAWTCEESKRIELSYLLKKGYLKKGKYLISSLRWIDHHGRSAGDIRIESNWGAFEDNIYIRLRYSQKGQIGSQESFDYKVFIEKMPSNLGKGDVLYFLCPASGERCRVLFKAYDSPIWKSRKAYKNFLYYGSQLSSKLSKANDQYWALEKRIGKIVKEKQLTFYYNGVPTKKALLLEKLREKQRYFDELRWSPAFFPVSIRSKIFGQDEENSQEI